MANDDPRPILDLLWKGIDPPLRGPRHRLTIERVVTTATDIAEEAGLTALSMRHVAAALGVRAPTLYTYIPSKAALLALMVDTMIAQSPLPHTRPGTWREKVAAWAREDLRDYRAHPWLVELVAIERPPGPGAMAWLDSALRIFDGTVLTDRERLGIINAVEGYVRGCAVLAIDADRTAGKVTSRGQDWSDTEWTYLADHIDDNRFPAIARLTDTAPGPGEAFEQGLTWLLDGIEHRIRNAPGPTCEPAHPVTGEPAFDQPHHET